MREMTAVQVADLIEADLGPGARGYFTTRGPRARFVPGRGDTDSAARGAADDLSLIHI